MKNIFLIGALFVMVSAANASEPIGTKTGLVRLGARYTSKMMCTCIFVMKRDTKYCNMMVQLDPNVFTWSIDRENKTVRAGLFIPSAVSAKAAFVNDRLGCQITK